MATRTSFLIREVTLVTPAALPEMLTLAA